MSTESSMGKENDGRGDGRTAMLLCDQKAQGH